MKNIEESRTNKFAFYNFQLSEMTFRGSSNGRTEAFGAFNRGSNPCPRANSKFKIRNLYESQVII